MLRTVLAAASAVLIFGSGPARATPFTLEDMLRIEQFGQVSLSPQETAVAFERIGPTLGAGPYEYDALDLVLRSQILVARSDDHTAPRPLLPEMEGKGHVIGAWSPDDRRLLIYRLRDRTFTAGIADTVTGEVQWLSGTPESAMWGRAAQWRNNDDLVMIQRADSDLPPMLRQGFHVQDRMNQLWRSTREGLEPGRTLIGGGEFLGLNPKPTDSRLVLVSANNGHQRTLASGRFHDLEIAPGGGFAAAVRFSGDRPFDPDIPFLQGDFSERRELTLADLESGETWEPLPGQDISPLLLAWSPSGDRLLVWARQDGEPWSDGRLMQIDPKRKTVTPTALGDFKPARIETGLRTEVVSADWLGETPILYAQKGERRDWVAFSDAGPQVLTADLTSPSVSLIAVSTQRLVVQAGAEAWSVDQTGRAEHLGRAVRTRPSITSALVSQGQRFSFNSPPRRDWTLTGDGDATWRVDTASGATIGARMKMSPRILAAGERRAVVATRDDHNHDALSFDGGPPMSRLNDRLSKVAFASAEAVTHQAPDGSPLVSWLYRPLKTGDHKPVLIVIPYPGSPAHAPAWADDNVITNVQLMTAAGYAVLIPCLPRPDRRGEPAIGMADDILRAVDAAAPLEAFDPDRLVLWGHSFGAFAAVAAATQSDRFSAVIAANGPYNLLSVWGQFSLKPSISPEDGLPVRSRAGWVETGQGGLGSPPFTDTDRYVRNSPALAADRITAPVLLFTADRDYVPPGQAEELFSALYRQQKDVVLVTYRGEGHVLSSPANIRDFYETVWIWLEEVLKRGAPPANR
ncbi:alpha/beta hydrolase family protein [Brevundimonas naejangsanensis]|uniref:alpha/beta hydrolase family protein n=1 Tax=Brevundimonas naejangsanensis TaxID=588932 RepID=UPI00320AADB1